MLHDLLSLYLKDLEKAIRGPELPTFPHHKHLAKDVIAAQEPSILEAIEEASLLAKE